MLKKRKLTLRLLTLRLLILRLNLWLLMKRLTLITSKPQKQKHPRLNTTRRNLQLRLMYHLLRNITKTQQKFTTNQPNPQLITSDESLDDN